ncbi:hypothetical protein ACS5NO_28380 [Larkinella sp. GY13]|uniref:hypothetical protein n=1 Tax=Larkinella sp. GY13 TaxID=3453720 RepID=UPI003EECBF75
MNLKLYFSPTHRKWLSRLFLGLFSVSLLFPITASIVNQTGQVYWVAGSVDVSVAFLCLFVSIVLITTENQMDTPAMLEKRLKVLTYLFNLPLVILAIYFLGIKLNWEVLLIGLGWRVWLFTMTLPYVIRAFYRKSMD